MLFNITHEKQQGYFAECRTQSAEHRMMMVSGIECETSRHIIYDDPIRWNGRMT